MARNKQHAELQKKTDIELLNQQPVGDWRADIALLRRDKDGDFQPGKDRIAALINRYPIPDEDLCKATLAWIAVGNPNASDKVTQYDRKNYNAACSWLGETCLKNQRFTWLRQTIHQAENPSALLKGLLYVHSGDVPWHDTFETLPKYEREAWDSLWWDVAIDEFDFRLNFFSMGLHHTWPPVHMQPEKLEMVARSAESAFQDMPAWQQRLVSHSDETDVVSIPTFVSGV